MAVVTKPTLKTYFEDGKEPDENKYIDLIDTMGIGDMSKSVYDTNDDGRVSGADTVPWAGVSGKPSTYPATTPVADSSKLGNVAAVEHLKRVSSARPGVTKLYRKDSDTGYNLQTEWDGAYWELKGYSGDTYHAPVQVGDSDKLDGFHATDLYRDNANFATSGYLDTSSYVDAYNGYRVNGTQGGIINLYADRKAYGNWQGTVVIGAGAYTLTRANYGYGALAYGLYGRLIAQGSGGSGYVGLNVNSSLYRWPLSVDAANGVWGSDYGIWWLTARGGNFIVRIGSASCKVSIEVWGEVR